MAIHTLKELEYKTAQQVAEMIKRDYKIDESRSGYDGNIFNVYLVHGKYVIEIHTCKSNDRYTKLVKMTYINIPVSDWKECYTYYKSHDDIYADSLEEANEELHKYYADLLTNTNPTCFEYHCGICQ